MAAFINVGIALIDGGSNRGSSPTSCFYVKDLKKLYQEKLSYLETPSDFMDNVHVTRLKNEILKRILNSCKQKKWKIDIAFP